MYFFYIYIFLKKPSSRTQAIAIPRTSKLNLTKTELQLWLICNSLNTFKG